MKIWSPERQAALMLVGLRDRLIRNRTQLANAIRGYAAEFGLAAAKGIAHLVDRIQADESLPGLARELFVIHAKEYAQLQAQIEEVEAKLMAWHKTDPCSRRLAQIPGVGPIGAAMLSMKTPAPEMFRSGRHVAASNVKEAEGRRENVVQSFSEDTAHLAVGQAIAFDQLAIRGPLLLELAKRRRVHHCAAGLELMDMNVYTFAALPPPRENRPDCGAVQMADRASTGILQMIGG
jgi:hypothetical protein